MFLRFVILALISAAILAGATSYLFRRLVRTFDLGPRARRSLAWILGVATALAAGIRLFGWVPTLVLAPIEIAAFIVMLTAVFAAVVLGGIDLALLLATLPERVRRRRAASTSISMPAPPELELATSSTELVASPPELVPLQISALEPALEAPIAAPTAPLPHLPRRAFLAQVTAGSAVCVGVSSSIYGTLVGRHDYAIIDVPARIPGLSRRLDGYTIVQLSDVHLGTFVGEPEVRAAEEMVRRARPDLLILTGDLIDHDPRYAGLLGRFVRRLGAYARDGVVAIPGNHDYYTGIKAVRAAITGAGGAMMINEGRVIGDAGAGFALLGIDDLYGPRSDARSPGPDLDRAIASVPADLPRVLLCHNPQFFPRAAGKVALQLSGHTHGGQINFGLPSARVVLGHSFIAGGYRLGETSLYVNRGFGTAGPPARIGAPPEVSRIILTV
ncbi:MAG: metallophosphoesterase [Byssovorax sp.]